MLDRGEPTFETGIMAKHARDRGRGRGRARRDGAKRNRGGKEPAAELGDDMPLTKGESPWRSLSPLSGRFVFSWHHAAQEPAPTLKSRADRIPAAAAATPVRERLATAGGSEEGQQKQERLAEYLHTGLGPLEQGLRAAKTKYLDTPDPLRMDPMRTLGGVRRRRQTTSSSEGLPPPSARCQSADPLNRDPVQYTSNPVARMETLPTEQIGQLSGRASPNSATPRVHQQQLQAADTAHTHATLAGHVQNISAHQNACNKKGPPTDRQETGKQPPVGQAQGSERRARRAARKEQEAESSSPHLPPAREPKHPSSSRRAEMDDDVSSGSMLSRSLSSSSLDVYRMLKARSRRERKGKHEHHLQCGVLPSNRSHSSSAQVLSPLFCCLRTC